LVKFEGDEIKKGSLIAYVYSPELVTAQKEFLEAIEIKGSQPELYMAVRNKLKLWKLSEKEINKIENSKSIKTNFPIYAVQSGVASNLRVKEGDHLMEGAILFDISNLNSLWVELDVYEKDISKIKKGDIFSIVISAFPNKMHEVLVDFIDPSLSSKSRTVTVRGRLDNAEGKFKPGMFVNGNLKISDSERLQEKIIVPKTAVLWTGKRSVVYQKLPKSEGFEMREVILGSESGENYEIVSGLNNDDEIVVNGVFTVDAAAQLAGKKSMMVMDSEENSLSVLEKDLYQEYLEVYFKIKDYLVIEDMEKIEEELNLVFSNSKLKRKSDLKDIFLILRKMKEASDLKEKRQEFLLLSNKTTLLVKKFDQMSSPVYLQHCPMAFDNGGSWLSREKQIMNPYFGDQMLHCGAVQQVFN